MFTFIRHLSTCSVVNVIGTTIIARRGVLGGKGDDDNDNDDDDDDDDDDDIPFPVPVPVPVARSFDDDDFFVPGEAYAAKNRMWGGNAV